MLDGVVLPPGLTLLSPGARLLPWIRSVGRAGERPWYVAGGCDLVGACCTRHPSLDCPTTAAHRSGPGHHCGPPRPRADPGRRDHGAASSPRSTHRRPPRDGTSCHLHREGAQAPDHTAGLADRQHDAPLPVRPAGRLHGPVPHQDRDPDEHRRRRAAPDAARHRRVSILPDPGRQERHPAHPAPHRRHAVSTPASTSP